MCDAEDDVEGRGALVEVDEPFDATHDCDDAHLPAIARKDIGTARGYADASRAPGTRRVYESDWRRFVAWCHARGLDSLPADMA